VTRQVSVFNTTTSDWKWPMLVFTARPDRKWPILVFIARPGRKWPILVFTTRRDRKWPGSVECYWYVNLLYTRYYCQYLVRARVIYIHIFKRFPQKSYLFFVVIVVSTNVFVLQTKPFGSVWMPFYTCLVYIL